MVTGNARRFSLEHLEAVIESFCYSYAAEVSYNTFKTFVIVQQRIDELAYLNASKPVLIEHVVNHLLFEIIEAQLMYHRNVFEQTQQLALSSTYQQAIQAIGVDAKTQSKVLLSWSFLYHVHMRRDLNISRDVFATASATHVRTLQRYKNEVCERLLQHVIALETRAFSQVKDSVIASDALA